ncbi:SpoVA/SpoVAEb family sporulation membrane protein, partial [Bacillus tropicus]
MEYLLAFVCGGIICIIGQLLLDIFKLTPAHVMTTFVVIGALLDGFGIYDKFIEFAGAGATVP